MEAINKEISAQQLYKIVGASAPQNAYQPVNLGKMGKIRNSNKSLTMTLRKLNFCDTTGLKALSPENVYKAVPSFTYQDAEGNTIVKVMEKFRAIVGEKTNEPYSVMSDIYNPVQHAEVLQTVADSIDGLGIRVVGRVQVDGGKMNMHAFLMGPQYEFSLLQDMQKQMENNSILGVRAFNSHTGKTGFGMEFFAIRMICTNYMGFGTILGKVYWNHKTDEADMIDGYKTMLDGALKGIPQVQKAMSDMDGETLYIDEATALMYGIGLQEANVEAMMGNLKGLNPEMDVKKPTAFDMYNVATAYVSHKVTGGLESGIQYSENIARIVTSARKDLMKKGFEKMAVIEERRKKEALVMSAKNTTIVG